MNHEEFFSGSDDGSIELWSIVRKKPVYIVRNAHAVLTKGDESKSNSNGTNPHGNYNFGIIEVFFLVFPIKL